MNNQENKSPLSSMVPILFLGIGLMLAMQYFNEPQKKPPLNPDAKGNSVPDAKDSKTANVAQKTQKKETVAEDFEFKKGGEGAPTTEVDTGTLYAVLSARGGRIDRFYVKSHDELRLPKAVVQASGDPIARREKALEATLGNGMDFQPHLYFYRQGVDGGYRLWQVADPALNEALYQGGRVTERADTKVKQVVYTMRTRLNRQNLEIIKVYRFLPNEHFFRQITAIRNLDNKPFELKGDLFYRTYGDIGDPETSTVGESPNRPQSSQSEGRFYAIAGSVTTRMALEGGGAACMGGVCGGSSGSEFEPNPNPLGILYYDNAQTHNQIEFLGSYNRYFLTYSKFMGVKENTLHMPDGMVVRKQHDPQGRETATVLFKSFKLAPSAGALDLGQLDENAAGADSALRANVAALQKIRNDAIIIDNVVYYGVRSDEAHAFRNPELAKKELGLTEPDPLARKQIFTYSYFSFFSPIKDFIVWLMRVVHGWVGNYGWAIIIIASGFKLLTFPLNNMQARSMKKMQLVKPEIERINETYKDDPQEKQKKVMELYRKYQINPFKGCLPMIIQMPVFIALFSAFNDSIELWKSPFILWMTDLSQPDTIGQIFGFNINILPILMLGSQLIYQMQSTVATDSQQKMMMYVMPVMFIFIFWSMPSGVTLYWTVQNIFSIIWHLASTRFQEVELTPGS